MGQAYCEVLVTSFLSNFDSTSAVEWFYMLIVILSTLVTHEFVSSKKDCCKVIPSKSVNFQHSRIKSMWFIVEIKGIVLSNTELGHCCLI